MYSLLTGENAQAQNVTKASGKAMGKKSGKNGWEKISPIFKLKFEILMLFQSKRVPKYE